MDRITTFGAGSHVPAATLNAMQDHAVGLLRASASPAGAAAVTGAAGRRWTSPDTTGVPDGELAVVDATAGVDWRNRTLWGWLIILESAAHRSHDTSAWQTNDPTRPSVARAFGGRSNTGTGGLRAGASLAVANGFPPSIEPGSFAVVVDEGATAAQRIYLYARPSDGALCLYNASGAALHAELLVFGSGVEPDPSAPPPDLIPTLTDVLWSPPTTAALRPATLGEGPYLHRATDTGAITLWDGGAWRSFGGAGNTHSSGTFASLPASPVAGDTYRVTSGPEVDTQYVCFVDGDWVSLLQAGHAIDMDGTRIRGLDEPILDGDAATKLYVDTVVADGALSTFLTTDGDIPMRIAGAPDRFATGGAGRNVLAATDKATARAALDLQRSVATKTTTYTAAAGDVLLCDASGGAFTVTLPAAAATVRPILVKKVDASGNAVTIDGAGSDTIDGALTIALSTQYEAVELWCDGTNWWVF